MRRSFSLRAAHCLAQCERISRLPRSALADLPPASVDVRIAPTTIHADNGLRIGSDRAIDPGGSCIVMFRLLIVTLAAAVAASSAHAAPKKAQDRSGRRRERRNRAGDRRNARRRRRRAGVMVVVEPSAEATRSMSSRPPRARLRRAPRRSRGSRRRSAPAVEPRAVAHRRREGRAGAGQADHGSGLLRGGRCGRARRARQYLRVVSIRYDRPMKRQLAVSLPLVGATTIQSLGGTGSGYAVAQSTPRSSSAITSSSACRASIPAARPLPRHQ